MKQKEALNILKMGHSALITGEAGTGKTHLLRDYLSWLREHDIEVAVTASTGIAATHIDGRTIHSWSGIGIKNELTEEDLEQMEQKQAVYRRLSKTEVIVIDEISMLSAEFVDMLDRLLKHIRRSEEPFGGVQMVFSGDFFQLPPITDGAQKPRYAFEAKSWRALTPVICYLTEQFRHADESFLNILTKIRNRDITENLRDELEKRVEATPDNPDDITRLFTHNVDVDELNHERLEDLDGFSEKYEMSTKGSSHHVKSLKRGCLAPEELRLKPGAEVMFIKNDPTGKYVNGTRGEVVRIDAGTPVVKTLEGKEVRATPESWKRTNKGGEVKAEITQVPLRLAWAITVHKSQGMTLDEAIIDLSQCFTPGQGYVALSRVRSLDGLYLKDFNDKALEVEKRVSKADDIFKQRSQMAQERIQEMDEGEIDTRKQSFLNSYS